MNQNNSQIRVLESQKDDQSMTLQQLSEVQDPVSFQLAEKDSMSVSQLKDFNRVIKEENEENLSDVQEKLSDEGSNSFRANEKSALTKSKEIPEEDAVLEG